MIDTQKAVIARLSALIGAELSASRRAADMLTLQFGPLTEVIGRNGAQGWVGAWALHIQCPWRLEVCSSIYTGKSDLWVPDPEPGDDFDWDAWNYESGNLRDKKMAMLIGSAVSSPNVPAEKTDRIFVENVEADSFGGARILMTGERCLSLFPDGTRDESWRFFASDGDDEHFVVTGGKVSYE